MKKFKCTVTFLTGVLIVGMLPTAALANESHEADAAGKKKQEGLFSTFGVRYWKPAISGDVKVKGSNGGTELGLKNDLDLHMKDILATSPDGTGLTAEDTFRLGYESYALTGEKQLDSRSTFHGVTYSAGETLKSRLDIMYLTAKWLPGYKKDEEKNTSLLLELAYYRHKQSEKGTAGKDDKEFRGIIPAIGYRAETSGAGNTAYYAEASGYPGKNYYYNAEVGALKRFGKLSAGVGYRACGQKIQSGDDYLEYKAKGPFFQTLYKF